MLRLRVAKASVCEKRVRIDDEDREIEDVRNDRCYRTISLPYQLLLELAYRAEQPQSEHHPIHDGYKTSSKQQHKNRFFIESKQSSTERSIMSLARAAFFPRYLVSRMARPAAVRVVTQQGVCRAMFSTVAMSGEDLSSAPQEWPIEVR